MNGQLPIIFNPVAGHGQAEGGARALEEVAASRRVKLAWWPTEAPGHAAELARQAVAEGAAMVLALGGDGTYNEVARGLLGSSTALAVLPGGTTSVLAYELSVPRPACEGLGALLDGDDRWMHVGRTDRGQPVLLMLSAGPDALILDRLIPSLKRLGGRLGVALQAVVELLRAELPSFTVSMDGQRCRSGWTIVGNSSCYAGPFRATPGASPFVADLEVVAQRSRGRCRALAFATSIPGGRHVERDDVERWRGELVELCCDEGVHVPYQIDGDVAGRLPVQVTVDSRRLLVRLPRA